MFKKLQQHWGVNGLQVFLILITFALGGSLCGYLGRKILSYFTIDSKAFWVIIYIVLVTLLWPLCVLLISIPLGQFSFFKNYVGKLMRKLKKTSPLTPLLKERENSKIIEEIMETNKINIAIFASGQGSNAEKIIEYFTYSSKATIALIVSNNAKAGVLQIAKDNNIDTLIINKEDFFNGDGCLSALKKHNIHFIALAGFLWKIPSSLISSYQKKNNKHTPSPITKVWWQRHVWAFCT